MSWFFLEGGWKEILLVVIFLAIAPMMCEWRKERDTNAEGKVTSKQENTLQRRADETGRRQEIKVGQNIYTYHPRDIKDKTGFQSEIMPPKVDVKVAPEGTWHDGVETIMIYGLIIVGIICGTKIYLSYKKNNATNG